MPTKIKILTAGIDKHALTEEVSSMLVKKYEAEIDENGDHRFFRPLSLFSFIALLDELILILAPHGPDTYFRSIDIRSTTLHFSEINFGAGRCEEEIVSWQKRFMEKYQ